MRSVTVDRDEAAVDREAVHGHLRARARTPRRSPGRCAIRGARARWPRSRPAGIAHDRHRPLALPVGGLDDARVGRRRVGRPARLRARRRRRAGVRWAILSVQMTADRGRDRVGHAAGPRRPPRAIRTGQSVPGRDQAVGVARGRGGRRRRPRSTRARRRRAGRRRRRSCARPARGRRRSRAAARARRRAPPSVRGRVRRPAPSAPRPGRPATIPDSRCTSGWSARAPRRRGCSTASPSSRAALSVEPMWRSTWPGPVGDVLLQARRLAQDVEDHVGDLLDRLVDAGGDVDRLADDPLERHLAGGRDRLGGVEHVQPVAAGVAVAVDRQRPVA